LSFQPLTECTSFRQQRRRSFFPDQFLAFCRASDPQLLSCRLMAFRMYRLNSLLSLLPIPPPLIIARFFQPIGTRPLLFFLSSYGVIPLFLFVLGPFLLLSVPLTSLNFSLTQPHSFPPRPKYAGWQLRAFFFALFSLVVSSLLLLRLTFFDFGSRVAPRQDN